MGTTSKIIYSSVLTLLVISMFLIFYMQKSAQLALDVDTVQETVAKKDHQIAEIQKTLETTNSAAENAQNKNKQIPELTQNITAIENEKAVLEKEKTTLLQQLDNLKGNVQKQSALASDRLAEITQLQKANEEHQQLLENTESQFNETTNSLATLQEELIKRDEQLLQFNADIEEKDQAISYYTEKLEATEETIALSKTKSTTKAMNLTLVLDELSQKTKLVNQLEEKIEQLAGSAGLAAIIPADPNPKDISANTELQALFEKMSKESTPPVDTELPKANALIQDLEIANATLLSNINAQSAKIQALQSELQKKEDSLASEKDKLRQQQMDNQALITELEITVKQGIDATIPLKEQITILEIQLAEALKNKSLLAEDISISEGVLAELLATNDSLTNELKHAQSALEEALEQITQLTGGIETAAVSLQQEEEARLALSTEMENLTTALSQAEEKYEALNVQYAELETEVKSKDEQQAEQVTSMQSLMDQQTAATEQSQSDLNAQLIAAQDETVSLKDEIEKFSASIAEKDSTIQELTTKISENSDQLTNLQTSLDQANEQINKDSEEQKQKIATLIEEVAAAKLLSEQQTESETALLSEKDAAIQDLTNQLSESSTKLNDEAAAAKKLSDEQHADLEAALGEKDTQLTENQEEIAALQATIATLTAEQEQLKLKNTDTDNDGVSDADDTCPETIEGGKVNAQGCEDDADSDGLVNRLDLCPETASGASIDNAGCSAEQTTVVLEGISFQFGTAELTEDAQSVLDIAAIILQNNPEITMEVAGHTDSIGEKESNLRLSTLRAQSVATYLVSKGVSADQLQAKGYGAEEPIADNTSDEGRAQNRRVELRKVEKALPTASE